MSTLHILVMAAAFTMAFWVVIQAIKTVRMRKTKDMADYAIMSYMRGLRRKHPSWTNRMIAKRTRNYFTYNLKKAGLL